MSPKLVTTSQVRKWVAENLAAHLTPFDLQIVGAREAYNHRYFLIGDEMGLGKSLQAAIAALMAGGRILVVCPAYLRKTWWATFKTMFQKDLVVGVFSPQEGGTHLESTDVAIASYDYKHLEVLFDWVSGTGTVIADEVQYLKSFGGGEGDSARAKSFHQLLFEYCPKRFIPLSGTPIENDVGEWFSPLAMLSYVPREGINGIRIQKDFPTKTHFLEKFCFKKEKVIGSRKVKGKKVLRTAVEYYGLRNRPLLKELLRFKYIRRTASESIDLPELLVKDIFVENLKTDQALLEEYTATLSDDRDTPAKARSALNKAKFSAEYAKELSAQGLGPILVYTDHVDAAGDLGERLNAPVITGKTSIPRRDRLKESFQGGELPYFVSTIGAGGVGLTLTRACHLVLNDMSWVPGRNDQVFKRFHRIGQTRNCRVHRIIGSPQDLQIMKRVAEKSDVLRRAM